MKEFTIKENEGFRLKYKSWKCSMPADLNAIEFIQETLKDKEVQSSSTYQFFMTDQELKFLAAELLK